MMNISYLKLSLQQKNILFLANLLPSCMNECGNPVRIVIFTILKKKVHFINGFGGSSLQTILRIEMTLGYNISVQCTGGEWEIQKHHASSTCSTIEEVANKEACVCALTLYRANNTVLRMKQIM